MKENEKFKKTTKVFLPSSMAAGIGATVQKKITSNTLQTTPPFNYDVINNGICFFLSIENFFVD